MDGIAVFFIVVTVIVLMVYITNSIISIILLSKMMEYLKTLLEREDA